MSQIRASRARSSRARACPGWYVLGHAGQLIEQCRRPLLEDSLEQPFELRYPPGTQSRDRPLGAMGIARLDGVRPRAQQDLARRRPVVACEDNASIGTKRHALGGQDPKPIEAQVVAREVNDFHIAGQGSRMQHGLQHPCRICGRVIERATTDRFTQEDDPRSGVSRGNSLDLGPHLPLGSPSTRPLIGAVLASLPDTDSLHFRRRGEGDGARGATRPSNPMQATDQGHGAALASDFRGDRDRERLHFSFDLEHEDTR
jgi:hypothetical protein